MELYTVDHGARYCQLHTLWSQSNFANLQQLGLALARGDRAEERRVNDEHKVLDRVREYLLSHPGR